MIKQILFFTTIFISLNSFAMSNENQKALDELLNHAIGVGNIPALKQQITGQDWAPFKIPSCTSAQELCTIIDQHGREGVVQKLIDLGADVNSTLLGLGETPLHAAAFSGHLIIAKMLINRGVRIKRLNNDEASPLYKSLIFHPESGVPELLIDNGALLKDSKELNQDELQNMLTGAITGKSLRFARLALSYGAEPNTKASLKYWKERPLDQALNVAAYGSRGTRQKLIPIIVELIRWRADLKLVNEPRFVLCEKENDIEYQQKIKPLLDHPATIPFDGNPVHGFRNMQITGKRKAPRLRPTLNKRKTTND